MPAYALLLLIGMLGGFFVVPLNALLQERGKQTVGAGNAIAVQNLGENMAMLLMLGIYSLAVKAGAPVVAIGVDSARCSRWRLAGCGSGSVVVELCCLMPHPGPLPQRGVKTLKRQRALPFCFYYGAG